MADLELDAAPGAAPRNAALARQGWLAVLGGIVAVLMSVMDLQMMNAAMAQIQAGVHAPLGAGAWLSSAYLLGEAAMLPVSGMLLARLGSARYARLFILLFVAVSILCTFATGMTGLAVLRAAQGLASGALIPFAYVLIIQRLPRDEHARAFAVFGATMALAPTLGPAVGGALAALFDWRVLFYINVPIGALALVLTHAGLRRLPAADASAQSVDWRSVATLAVALGALQFVLQEGRGLGWLDSPLIVALLALAGLMLVGFVGSELHSTRALVDRGLLRNQQFVMACAANALACGATFASYFAIPYFLISVRGAQPQQIGQVIMLTGATQFVVLWFTPAIGRRLPLFITIALGAGLFAAGTFGWSALVAHYTGAGVAAAQIARGIGLSLLLAPLCVAATTVAQPAQAASASILYNMSRSLGGSLGVTLAAAGIDAARAARTLAPGSGATVFAHAFGWMGAVVAAIGAAFCIAWVARRANVHSGEG
ncbi:hypothetical protein WI73_14115 [Burkholderia ubonensis]|uniref:MFS transporter n=1 Tax=Burkholderia ubonensis TaxID=101571 RepID=UPI0007544AA6|nr:MFS transporter [Burkholderia ubonensis]KVC54254.1 hypothetical protein WI72_20545 [Burkholderia ubonensis]KVC69956.1 hypothetical protein WI73_14115 [Burkholderia ubonensis]KVD88390.1 hypothetical protein WI90_19925 [Burkholderia ubonensis]